MSRDGRHNIAVKQKGYADLGVYFAPNAAMARRDATADNSYTAPRKRNVVLDQEGGAFPQFLDACLTSR